MKSNVFCLDCSVLHSGESQGVYSAVIKIFLTPPSAGVTFSGFFKLLIQFTQVRSLFRMPERVAMKSPFEKGGFRGISIYSDRPKNPPFCKGGQLIGTFCNGGVDRNLLQKGEPLIGTFPVAN
ncbi:MAG: hypothetical protein C4519_13845 [Desulfobacteraceae bacterium]|nr:MAG: hypothetical protein C4519_13845 [Desulfobacteraceae bacterium]